MFAESSSVHTSPTRMALKVWILQLCLLCLRLLSSFAMKRRCCSVSVEPYYLFPWRGDSKETTTSSWSQNCCGAASCCAAATGGFPNAGWGNEPFAKYCGISLQVCICSGK